MLDKFRFRHQLTIIFSVGITVLAVITALVVSEVSSRAMRDRFIDEGIKLTEALSVQSLLAVLYASEDVAADSAHIFMSFPDVRGVKVYNSDFSILYSEGALAEQEANITDLPDSPMLYREYEDLWEFIAPVYTGKDENGESPLFDEDSDSNESIVGYVQLAQGKQTLQKISSDIFVYNIVVSTLIALGLFLSLMLITHRLMKPFSDLARAMRSAEYGQTDVRVEKRGSRDIVEMQHAFNTMMGQIEDREIELKAARDQAMELVKIKSQFAANVSHELRTPMNGVLGMLQLLADFDMPKAQKNYVNTAINSAQYLLSLINHVLDFSKNETDKVVIESREFDLRDDVSDIIVLLSSEAKKKKINFTYVIDPKTPRILAGDNYRIRQILLNLVGNALKFTSQGSVSIVISLIEQNEGKVQVRFDVCDTGIGISEEQCTTIFDAFSQADGSTTRRFGGTGLGLAISKQAASLLGGDLGVQSVEGEGSVFGFSIYLGYSRDTILESARPQLEKKPALLLLIDEDQNVLECLSHFARSCGIAYSTAQSYDEALSKISECSATKNPVDVALISEALSGNDSRKIITALDNEKLFRDIQLIITGFDLRKTWHEANPYIYLEKPFVLAQFVEAIAKLWDNKTTISAPEEVEEKPVAYKCKNSFSEYKVLAVEDNTTNQQVILGFLEYFGCQVDVAENGVICLDKISKNRYDLVLMDCHMPEMDGYEATRRIRAKEAEDASGVRLPIIAMTANTMEGDLEKCLEVGMDEYLSKPLTRTAIEEKLLTVFPEACDNTPTQPMVDTEKSKEPKNKLIDEQVFANLEEILGPKIQDLVLSFLESLPALTKDIGEGLTEDRVDDVYRAAHTMKGMAGNLGAITLAEISKEIEATAKNGSLTGVDKLYESLSHERDALLQHFESYT